MLRGFLSGLIWGVVIVVAVVAIASLLAPLPATVTPQTSAVEGTGGALEANDSAAPTGSRTDEAVEEPVQPVVSAPEESETPPLADTDPAPRPETGSPEGGLVTPEDPADGGAVAVEGESPVLPNPQAVGPDAPEAEAEPSISTNPPQPPAPEVTEGQVFPTPEVEPVPEPEPAPGAAEVAESEEDVTPVAEEGAPPAGEGETSLLQPAGELEERFPQHKSNRLPTVGGDEAPEAEAEPGAETVAAPLARPVIANAETFENPEAKPVMAIVLADVGNADVDVEALSGFPYPLSVAVSTLDPEFAAKSERYRGKGFEVLAMIDIPAAAEAADVEVAMQAHLSVAPRAVGVMEGFGEGLQGSKVVSDQVAQVLAGSGHGLVMLPKGLNTAQKLAAKEGVPSASVFRDFDAKGQSAVVIRRFLDQAAFKAGQEGGVVMLGRLRPETVSALLLWGLQDRAGTVALAPVSAALDVID